MSLKLMYITNDPDVAKIAEKAGVDRIFVDMEYIRKEDRQSGMDTVQSHHTIEDIRIIRNAISDAELLVRVNPIHEKTELYSSSQEEINLAIDAGADILMLPYFKTKEEVELFVNFVAGRAKTMILVETREAAEMIDQIIEIDGVDEYFIGLNDLSIGYGMKFMFEPLSDGTVERLCEAFRRTGKPYGIGGISALGTGLLPAEHIIIEQYRLESSSVILSRSFCNLKVITDLEEIESVFTNGIRAIRDLEAECVLHKSDRNYFDENKSIVAEKVKEISASMK